MSKYIPIDERYYTGRQVCDILSAGLGIAQFRYMLEMFSREPSAIVRCKDCRYNYANLIPNGSGCSNNVELKAEAEWYCADGERE